MPATTEVKSNPYASGSSAAKDAVFDGAPKERMGRSFKFNPKGKYVQLGNQMRQEVQMEALKQRIAENARKAGLDSEFETLEKNIKVCLHFSRPWVPCVLFLCDSANPHRRSNGGMPPSFLTRLTMILSWDSLDSTFVPRTPP